MFIHQSHFQDIILKHELHQFNFHLPYNTLLSHYGGLKQKIFSKI